MAAEIHFATSRDGVRIAWSKHGRGLPIVRVGTWMTHLEYDWENPGWRHWLIELGHWFTVIRYDDRGCGLSDPDPPRLDLDAWVGDLEAVIDASGYDQVVLLGMSQGAAIGVAFAARHPNRVSRLICLGGYARGQAVRGHTAAERQEREALATLVRLGWGRAEPNFRRLFTNRLIPGGSEAQMRWFDEEQRRSTTGEVAARIMEALGRVDVSQMAPRVRVPTLVLHARDDATVPFEEGRQLAALIPGARFTPLVSANHVLLADEPAWPRFLETIAAFIRAEQPAVGAEMGTAVSLTDRELEALTLVAAGRSNAEIAAELSISIRTVERHLTNVYARMGLHGRSARAAAAARLAHVRPLH